MGRIPSTVGLSRGEGLVARFGGVVLYLTGETPSTERILGAAEAAAGAGDPGVAIAQRLAAAIFSGGSAQSPSFGVVAPTSGGLLLLLRGPVRAVIEGPEGPRELSGDRAMTWADEIIRDPVRRITVSADGTAAEVAHTDLRSGVVPGGGFVLHAPPLGATDRRRGVPKSATAQSPTPPEATGRTPLPTPSHTRFAAPGDSAFTPRQAGSTSPGTPLVGASPDTPGKGTVADSPRPDTPSGTPRAETPSGAPQVRTPANTPHADAPHGTARDAMPAGTPPGGADTPRGSGSSGGADTPRGGGSSGAADTPRGGGSSGGPSGGTSSETPVIGAAPEARGSAVEGTPANPAPTTPADRGREESPRTSDPVRRASVPDTFSRRTAETTPAAGKSGSPSVSQAAGTAQPPAVEPHAATRKLPLSTPMPTVTPGPKQGLSEAEWVAAYAPTERPGDRTPEKPGSSVPAAGESGSSAVDFEKQDMSSPGPPGGPSDVRRRTPKDAAARRDPRTPSPSEMHSAPTTGTASRPEKQPASTAEPQPTQAFDALAAADASGRAAAEDEIPATAAFDARAEASESADLPDSASVARPSSGEKLWAGEKSRVPIQGPVVGKPAPDSTTVAQPPGVLTAAGGTTYPLDRQYVIGRDPLTDDAVRQAAASPILLAGDRHVSRVHARLFIDGAAVFVQDAATPGGTFVAPPGAADWTRLGTRRFELKPGWSIRIGDRILTYSTGPGRARR